MNNIKSSVSSVSSVVLSFFFVPFVVQTLLFPQPEGPTPATNGSPVVREMGRLRVFWFRTFHLPPSLLYTLSSVTEGNPVCVEAGPLFPLSSIPYPVSRILCAPSASLRAGLCCLCALCVRRDPETPQQVWSRHSSG